MSLKQAFKQQHDQLIEERGGYDFMFFFNRSKTPLAVFKVRVTPKTFDEAMKILSEKYYLDEMPRLGTMPYLKEKDDQPNKTIP